MAEHNIRLNIGSKAELTAFDKVKSAVRDLGHNMKSSLAGIGQNLMNIKAGFEMLGGAIRTAYSGLKKAFDFQTMTQQFKFLLGSMDEAKQHMETLKELGATPPFSMEEFAAASRQMVLLSDGVLGLEDSLKLVGDVAAATGRPVEEVGEAVARAYSMIRDGQPVQRAVFQLRNMGAITPKVAAELKTMQETGANGVQIWEKLEEALGKYSGAMNETTNTVNGALGALSSAWDDALRDLGESTTDALTGSLNELTQWIRDLEENGTLEDWGAKVVSVMVGVAKAVGVVADAIGKVWNHLKFGMDDTEEVVEQADEARELISEEKINPYRTKRTYRQSNGGITEEYEADERAERKWLREKERAKRQAAEREKVRKSLENSKMASKPEKAEKTSKPNGQYQSEEDHHKQAQENIKAYRDAMRKFRLEGAKKDAEAQIEAQKKTKDMLEDKIDNLDEKLKKLNDTEKEVADKVKKAEEARRNDPNSQVTGEGRKAARNAQQNDEAEAVKQRNREKAREHRMENLEKIAGRRGGLNWLSKKQVGELQAWWNEKNNKKKLEEIKNQVKQAEKERKEYQEKMKKIPDRIKSIQDNLDKFIKQNEVK